MKTPFNSMAGRVFLILVAGVLASAILTNFLSSRERQNMVGQLRGAHTAERVVQLILTLDALPATDRRLALAGAASAGLAGELNVSTNVREPREPDPALAAILEQRLGTDRSIRIDRDTCPEGLGDRPFPHRTNHPSFCRVIQLQLKDGTPARLVVHVPPPPPGPLHGPGALIWLGFFLSCIALLAWLVARMATRPLRTLATAATELGKDIDRPPLSVEGPQEVRHAAAAFNAMQERIHRYVGERMRMLAAVTHDLQTPLTRLRLRLEKVEDRELRERLVEDLAATQAMIRQGLDLVRNLEGPLNLRPLELASLLDSLCEDAADAGQDVRLEETSVPGPLVVSANADTLRRCLNNLLDNAVKYGQQARVCLTTQNGRVRIAVRDGGPGIPADQIESVFEPFARLETSRSRDTGGTGLGLTIARAIARRHGGTLVLKNHPDGGLEALLELPLPS